ncbi:MAG: hypothetical protein AAGL96_18995, partial [Pseudomonadota bacterium]
MDMKAFVASEAEKSLQAVIVEGMEVAARHLGRRVALVLAAEALGRLEEACMSVGDKADDIDDLIAKNREAGRVAQQELMAEARFGKQT